MALTKPKSILLKPNKSLLDPEFDGYKLYSSTRASCYSHDFNGDICLPASSDSYLQTRILTLFNHLFCDPFNRNLVYFFNGHKQLMMVSVEESKATPPTVILNVDLTTARIKDSVYPCSLCFLNKNFAVLSDGLGSLTLLETEERPSKKTWKNKASLEIESSLLIQSLYETLGESKMKLHILLQRVVEMDQLTQEEQAKLSHIKTSSSKLNMVHWMTLIYDGGSDLTVSCERKLVGRGAVEFLSLSKSGDTICFYAHQNFCIVYDSNMSIPDPSKEDSRPISQCLFKQNNDEITLYASLPCEVNNKDIHVQITDKDLNIAAETQLILSAKFLYPVEASTSTWNANEGRLEISAMKKMEGEHWQSLFKDNNPPAEEMRNEEAEDMLKSLSQQLGPESSKPAYNPGELEECDAPQEDSVIQIFQKDKITCVAYGQLGITEHLFTKQNLDGQVPSFCVRHDVDGLLYEMKEDNTFDHVFTFHALGYVKAAKTAAKFSATPYDNSYAAIAESHSHIYVYYHAKPLGSELRNRRTGTVATKTSAQLLISLKTHDEVMGFHCLPEGIFVLTRKTISFWALPEIN